MRRFQNVVLSLLIVGIAVQLWIGNRGLPEGDDRAGLAEPIDVGDSLLRVTGYTEPNAPVAISLDDRTVPVTVIYTFHPECSHSRAQGRAWARHFDRVRTTDDGVRRIALTQDSLTTALAFAEHFAWQVEVLSVAGLSLLQREYSLVERSPWVFVFDSRGVLRLHGHGSQLDRIEAAVLRLLSE